MHYTIFRSVALFNSVLFVSTFMPHNPCTLSEQEWKNTQQNSDFFNAKKLADASAMRNKLIMEEGFKEVAFKTDDAITLRALLRTHPKAAYNLVSFCGFFPGKKEGMATLVELFPRNINMLLVDARGHGQSEGLFIASGGDYGLDEPRDVRAALNFIREATGKPTIVHGICMGGRHATIALAQLSATPDPLKTQQSLLATYNVRGFICDSAPIDASSIKHILNSEVTQKMLPQWIKKIPGYRGMPKKKIQKTYLFRALAAGLSRVITVFRYIWFDRTGINFNEASGAILSKGKAQHIACPVFLIHADKEDIFLVAVHAKLPKKYLINGNGMFRKNQNTFKII